MIFLSIVVCLFLVVLPLIFWFSYKSSSKENIKDNGFIPRYFILNNYQSESDFLIYDSIEDSTFEINAPNIILDGGEEIQVSSNTHANVVYNDRGFPEYLVGGAYYNGLTYQTKTYFDSNDKTFKSVLATPIDLGFSPEEGRWSFHHEEWLDNDIAVALLGGEGKMESGDTDEDRVAFFNVENKNGIDNYEYINSFDVLSSIGLSEDDLISGNDFSVLPTTSETFTNEDDIVDFLHTNSFDIDKSNNLLFVNSRTLGAILIYDISDIMNIKFKYIVSNPSTYNFLYEDENKQHPIIKSDGSSFTYHGYMHNNDYIPRIAPFFEDKTFDYVVNGEKYLAADYNGWDLSEEYMFAGEHSIRNLNSFIEKSSNKKIKENVEYISIFDNHSMQDSPYLMNQEVSKGLTYDKNSNGKNDRGSFANGRFDLSIDSLTSYFKVIKLDLSNKTATLLANEEVEYSNVVSNAYIYEYRDEKYVFTCSGNATDDSNNLFIDMSIYSFDYFDENYSNVNDSLVGFNKLFSKTIEKSDCYRAIPLFENASNVLPGWGMYY